jgi:hypothetical protein
MTDLTGLIQTTSDPLLTKLLLVWKNLEGLESTREKNCIKNEKNGKKKNLAI